MIKLLHAADFHLDSPLGAAGPSPAVRRAELRRTAERVFELAGSEKVDIILLAGDLFDNNSPYLGTVELLKQLTLEAKVPVCIAPGNHDYYSERSPYAQDDWPENVHIFSEPALSGAHFSSLGCNVWGAAFTSPMCQSQPLQGFQVPEGEDVNIILLHGEVTTASSRYGAITPQQILKAGADYLALGHIHAYSGLHTQDDRAWAWPGCPEGRGFDETGDKGVIIAEIEKGRVDIRFESLARRRYYDITVDPDCNSYPLQAVLSALPMGTEDDICRIVFRGQSGKTGLQAEALRLALSERFYSLELLDRTVLSDDIWNQANQDSLRGLFLQSLREKNAKSETPDQEHIIMLAAHFGLAALDGREAPKGGKTG